MRTALFFVVLAIRDVAEALGAEPLSNYPKVVSLLGTLIIISMVMDVIDFLRGKK